MILDGNENIFAIDVNGRQIAFMSPRHGTWDIFVVDREAFLELQLTDNRQARTAAAKVLGQCGQAGDKRILDVLLNGLNDSNGIVLLNGSA